MGRRDGRVGRHRLHKAAAQAELAWVRDLLAANPSLATHLDSQLASPLHWAASGACSPPYRPSLLASFPTTREAIVRMLLEAAPQLAGAIDAQGRTPLHRAAACGQAGAVRLLLAAAPAAVSAADFSGCTPLHAAAACPGAGRAVAALLRVAPWVALATNEEGATPLFLAVRAASHLCTSACPADPAAVEAALATVRLLLAEAPAAARLPTNARSGRQGFLPLLQAASQGGPPALVAALLAAAPDTAMAADAHGDTALHWASQWGKGTDAMQVRRLLLEAAPAAALVQDADGDTPLHCCALEGNHEAVEQLVLACPAAAAVRNKTHKAVPFELSLSPRAAGRPGGPASARALVAAGPAAVLVPALAAAIREPAAAAAAVPSRIARLDAELAVSLVPAVVARWALAPALWAQLPAVCPGLEAALPAVLARSDEEAAQLAARLTAAPRRALQAAMLCLARAQRAAGVPLPVVSVREILALSVAGS